MPLDEIAIALRRFGLGPKPGDVGRAAGDPRGSVLACLSDPSRALIVDPELEPSHVVLTAVREAQQAQNRARDKTQAQAGQDMAAAALPANAAAQPRDGAVRPGPVAPSPSQRAEPPMSERPARGVAMSQPEVTPRGGDPAGAAEQKPGKLRRETMIEEKLARYEHARQTDAAFLERLVMFWSNHFCVSVAKAQVRGIAGAFEREAIRPHVLGRFVDMLKAVEQHPAMLIYLDQAQSIGPNSTAGGRRQRGLNENLAREILELHTLGVDGGYGQDDVTNLARILTGWTVGGPQQPGGEPGRFAFLPQRHEPGPWTVVGRRYEAGGLEMGERCLDDLAAHPSTARHIARKLAQHFVSSNPPPGLVARLETSFRETGGDLGALATALATAPECWAEPLRKITSPYEFCLGLSRGLSVDAHPGEMLRLAQALGQPIWQPPGPQGWPDLDESWLGPSPIRERLRVAEKASRLVPKLADPRAVAVDLFGPALSDATREAIRRAETREQGFVLLIMSPDFQRR